MKKLKATIFLNRIPITYNIQTDFATAQKYHLSHGVEWDLTFVNVDVHGYTSQSVQVPLAGQRWLIENSQNFLTLDPNADVNIFCFDEAEWATPTGSQFPLLPNTPTGCCYLVNGKPFINIACYAFDHNDGQTAIEIAHEQMHALAKMANCKDQMDTYYENNLEDLPNSNFMIQWGLLANFLNSMNTPTYKYFNPISDPLMVGVSPVLMAISDKARGIAGVPFKITSGIRSPSQNALAGGASDSTHLLGEALDIACTDQTRWAIFFAFVQAGIKRLEVCPNHIHADIGNAPTYPQNWLGVSIND